jgi:antitoxin HicB
MTKLPHYPSQVFWDEDDQGFVAIAPDLPGCSAFGATEAKALKELRIAIELWISAAKSMDRPIPAPSKLPVPSAYSGKVLLRMAPSLHQKLAKEAEAEEVSLNHWIVTILASGFKAHNSSYSQYEVAIGDFNTVSTSPRLMRAFSGTSSFAMLDPSAFHNLVFVHPLKTINYSATTTAEAAHLEGSNFMPMFTVVGSTLSGKQVS